MRRAPSLSAPSTAPSTDSAAPAPAWRSEPARSTKFIEPADASRVFKSANSDYNTKARTRGTCANNADRKQRMRPRADGVGRCFVRRAERQSGGNEIHNLLCRRHRVPRHITHVHSSCGVGLDVQRLLRVVVLRHTIEDGQQRALTSGERGDLGERGVVGERGERGVRGDFGDRGRSGDSAANRTYWHRRTVQYAPTRQAYKRT